jgi:hypothetical protein
VNKEKPVQRVPGENGVQGDRRVLRVSKVLRANRVNQALKVLRVNEEKPVQRVPRENRVQGDRRVFQDQTSIPLTSPAPVLWRGRLLLA